MGKEEFSKALPLLGEDDMPAAKVESTFKEVDADGSGKLDFDEFCKLIKLLNPKQAEKEKRDQEAAEKAAKAAAEKKAKEEKAAAEKKEKEEKAAAEKAAKEEK